MKVQLAQRAKDEARVKGMRTVTSRLISVRPESPRKRRAWGKDFGRLF
jgi:hypothetical protein